MSAEEKAFRTLIALLAKENYHFICPSSSSQARVIQRRNADRATRHATSLSDFFGWNLPAEEETLVRLLSLPLLERLRNNKIVRSTDVGYRAVIRVSDFYLPHVIDTNHSNHQGKQYFIHPAFPPVSKHENFFGPETYLYLDFLSLTTHRISRDPCIIVEVCCDSGAGAMYMTRRYSGAQVFGLYGDPKQLEFGRLNANLAEVKVDFLQSDLYAGLPHILQDGDVDMIVSNPMCPLSHSASSAGDEPGFIGGRVQAYAPELWLPIQIVEQGIRVLALGGILAIFTQVQIAIEKPGYDPFLHWLQQLEGVETVEYRIVHPDIGSEEVWKGKQEVVGRVQLVGAILRKFT